MLKKLGWGIVLVFVFSQTSFAQLPDFTEMVKVTSVPISKAIGKLKTVPPNHPFNPLHAQRLLTGLGAPREAVEAAYDFVWRDGRDVPAEWPLFCERLGIGLDAATALIADPAVKQKLADNTSQAAAQGVFGVPTLAFRGQSFWGSDSNAWANAFIDDPQLFDSGEMKRAAEIGIGAARKEVR